MSQKKKNSVCVDGRELGRDSVAIQTFSQQQHFTDYALGIKICKLRSPVCSLPWDKCCSVLTDGSLSLALCLVSHYTE